MFPGEPICGNGLVERDEECDDGALNSDIEPDACRPDCRSPRCGDQVADSDEACDDGNNDSGDGCSSDCRSDETCGNGIIDRDDGEECDCGSAPSALPAGCNTPNADDETSVCTTSCMLRFCGNGVREALEQCDGADLGGMTCELGGYYGGELRCRPACVYDYSGCQGICGDGVLNGHEVCDGSDFGGGSCSDFGFNLGVLSCMSACIINVSGCHGWCGDGIKDETEECDTAELGDADCEGLGFVGGSLRCGAGCDYDTSGCNMCGNSVLDATEQCDGPEHGGTTCLSLGFDGGILRCDSRCLHDTSLCAMCGNGRCEVGELSSCHTDCLLQPISVGESHTCSVKVDGTVWCWGSNLSGQLGDGTTAQSNAPVQVVGPGGTGFLTGVVSLSTGKEHSCAILADGTVWCWGQGMHGQLGNGTTGQSNVPVHVLGPGGNGFLADVTAISAGGYGENTDSGHTCASKSDGTLWCWGQNASGQLGDGTTSQSDVPVQVLGPDGVGMLGSVVTVGCGGGHTCAVKLDGTLLCWGNGANGRLGHGSTWSSSTPVDITVLQDVRTVSAGGYHTCAVKDDGSLWCWGQGGNGQLGTGLTMDSNFPSAVVTLGSLAAVEAGMRHTCAVKTDGTTWCWGYNFYGQVGDGTWQDLSLPVQVLPGSTHVSAGYHHSCAHLVTGGIECWGGNASGQLGMGTSTQHSLPLAVSGTPSATAVDSGANHTCALADDTTAWCWGENGSGQLGDSTTTNSGVPVQVLGPGGVGFLSNVSVISAGGLHTCAALLDGTAWCWGSNSRGQIGAPAWYHQASPVAVVGF